jgi:hypothetical protein
LNGLADSAVLAALTPAMMTQSADAARAAASGVFNAGTASVGNATCNPAQVTVTVTDTVRGPNLKRSVSLTWSGQYRTLFTGIFGQDTLPIAGESSARSALAPNIDIHLLVDTSPSMAVAANDAAIQQMIDLTSPKLRDQSCAFACHQASVDARSAIRFNGDPNNAQLRDSYEEAELLQIPLRIDVVKHALATLFQVAPKAAAENHVTYRMSFNTFDFQVYPRAGLTNISGNMSGLNTLASQLAPLEVYDNNHRVRATDDSDTDTNIDLAVGSMLSLPKPGTGLKGDTPQEVVFLVTDAVNDLGTNWRNRTIAVIDADGTICRALKAKGIRIAVLYLTYPHLPSTTQGATSIQDIQNDIAPAAETCATPGLYFQVDTNANVDSALIGMFQKVIATARLVPPAP